MISTINTRTIDDNMLPEHCLFRKHTVPKNKKSYQYTFYDVPITAKKCHKSDSPSFAIIEFDENNAEKHNDVRKSYCIKIIDIKTMEQCIEHAQKEYTWSVWKSNHGRRWI